MSEPTTEPGAEVAAYVRVAPSPVTDGKGQGTGDRTGDRVGEGGPGGVPRADVSRDAGARDRIIAALQAVTQRRGWPACLEGTGNALQGLAFDVAAVWRDLRGELWMRGSDNTALRISGYLWAFAARIPAVAIAHLVAVVAAFLADVVALLAARNGRSVAAVAIVAAVWFVWPFGSGHQAPPPTAETEIVVHDGGAR